MSEETRLEMDVRRGHRTCPYCGRTVATHANGTFVAHLTRKHGLGCHGTGVLAPTADDHAAALLARGIEP